MFKIINEHLEKVVQHGVLIMDFVSTHKIDAARNAALIIHDLQAPFA